MTTRSKSEFQFNTLSGYSQTKTEKEKEMDKRLFHGRKAGVAKMSVHGFYEDNSMAANDRKELRNQMKLKRKQSSMVATLCSLCTVVSILECIYTAESFTNKLRAGGAEGPSSAKEARCPARNHGSNCPRDLHCYLSPICLAGVSEPTGVCSTQGSAVFVHIFIFSVSIQAEDLRLCGYSVRVQKVRHSSTTETTSLSFHPRKGHPESV